jgi:uncharacterized C2H2 Zn-finger protein
MSTKNQPKKVVLKLVKKWTECTQDIEPKKCNELCESNKKTDHPCTVCSKTFHTSINLDQHMYYIHSAKKQYICGFCGEHEYVKANLIRHIRNCPKFDISAFETDDDSCTDSVITCGTECSDGCERAIEVSKSELEHKFICDDCGHTFKQKGNMDKHRLKIHGIPLPSTRQTRHKLRMKYKLSQYQSKELDSKRRARFVIYDTVNNKTLEDENGEIKLSKSECKKYVDNCNIVHGIMNVYNNADTETTSELHEEWNCVKDALLSFMEDRPNQKDMVVSIVQNHMDL